jgi:Ser/Thr protein kinase RdoA (MazF antagonist)
VDHELLEGGVNQILRVGDRVHRPVGPWTPAVHALLRHLASAEFAGAPRVHGIAASREVLDFVPGEVPSSEFVGADAVLASVGRLLRAYHDATVSFAAPPDVAWYLPPREPAEVICHGDVAPYNTVFRDGQPVAFIDFDTAHPGPRVWDVAYAAYRFVPLRSTGADHVRRLGVFCAAYGLDAADRAVLLPTAVERLRAMSAHIRREAAAGHPAFSVHLAEGHADLYDRDAGFLSSLSGSW